MHRCGVVYFPILSPDDGDLVMNLFAIQGVQLIASENIREEAILPKRNLLLFPLNQTFLQNTITM
jgi:hypothetical protein